MQNREMVYGLCAMGGVRYRSYRHRTAHKLCGVKPATHRLAGTSKNRLS